MITLDELLDTTGASIRDLNERIRECTLAGNAAAAVDWAAALRDAAAAYDALAAIDED